MTDALEKLQALRDKVGSLDRVAPLVSAELSTDIGNIIASLTDEGWVDAGVVDVTADGDCSTWDGVLYRGYPVPESGRYAVRIREIEA